jgi:hypothetical protein
MFLKKLSVLVASSAFLSACETVVSTPIIEPLPIIAPEPPRAITTKPVSFIVVTNSNRDKLDSSTVWYAITPEDYENLAYNLQEMLRYIRQQKLIINYYVDATSF